MSKTNLLTEARLVELLAERADVPQAKVRTILKLLRVIARNQVKRSGGATDAVSYSGLRSPGQRRRAVMGRLRESDLDDLTAMFMAAGPEGDPFEPKKPPSKPKRPGTGSGASQETKRSRTRS